LVCDLLGQRQVNIAQHIQYFTLLNMLTLDFTQLKHIGIYNMLLFMRLLALVENTRMTKVVIKRWAALTDFMTVNTLLIAFKATSLRARCVGWPVVIN